MLVKIITCSSSKFWYSRLINSIFEVTEVDERYEVVRPKTKPKQYIRMIDIDDCEILNDKKEKK